MKTCALSRHRGRMAINETVAEEIYTHQQAAFPWGLSGNTSSLWIVSHAPTAMRAQAPHYVCFRTERSVSAN
jgi:hypothetical protein